MTLDHAVALSLRANLPRVNLTERLKNDPNLLSRALPRLEEARAMRARAERAGIHVVAWNDTQFPAALTTLTDLPPVSRTPSVTRNASIAPHSERDGRSPSSGRAWIGSTHPSMCLSRKTSRRTVSS